MEIIPIIAALSRNKVGALLMGLQIALTLAIVCNSLSVIQQRLQRTHRLTGLDEANIFTFRNQWVGQQQDLAARIREDLTALRSLPGVIDVVATDAYPLSGRGPDAGIMKLEQKQPTVRTAYYLVDEHGLPAFGARLVAGRGFAAEEIRNFRLTDTYVPSVMIVTSTLAKSLFPSGDALGKSVYLLSSDTPSRIVGIVDKFQAASILNEQFIENSTFLPAQLVHKELSYIVRTRNGQRDAVMQVVPNKLLTLSRARIIDNVLPFSEIRARAYRGDRVLSLILGAVCGLLLTVTAFGVIGLTTYWVTQRRQQIGVRRALGARRIDILRYFHTENFLISGAGGALGIALGLAGNLWLVTSLQLTRINIEFLGFGAAIVLVLSQAAVVWPALRATRVSPAIAARGAQ